MLYLPFLINRHFSVKNKQKQIRVKLFILHNRTSWCELLLMLKHPVLQLELDPYQVVDWIRQGELNIREHC